jgi:hypothetical protein
MLNILIEEGQDLKRHIKECMGLKTINGEEYALWTSKCVRFLETEYPSSENTKQFIELSRNITENVEVYYKKVAIMKAFEIVKEDDSKVYF